MDKRENLETTIYELYCQLVEPEQAKHITRFLIEYCNCDENSHAFFYGLMNVIHLRVGLGLPNTVAKTIAAPLVEFQATAQALMDAMGSRQDALKRQKNLRDGWGTWPLSKQYDNKVANCFQKLVRRFEDAVSFRARWIILMMSIVGLASYLAVVHGDRLALVRSEDLYAEQIAALKKSEADEKSALQEQYADSLEQRANELANTKLQNLEPRSYHLAKQIEQASQRIQFADKSIGWAVRFHEVPGVPSSRLIFEKDLTTTVLLYIKEQSDRVDLATTAPAATPSNRSQTSGKPH